MTHPSFWAIAVLRPRERVGIPSADPPAWLDTPWGCWRALVAAALVGLASPGCRGGGAAQDAGATSSSVSVLQHHLHANRDGSYIDPLLTHANAARMHLDPAFDGRIKGSVYSQPLYVDRGGPADLLIVATEQNVVEALAADGGLPVWETALGPEVPISVTACGTIDPQGVTGTPVIDEDAGVLYLDSLQLGDGGTFADGDQIQVHQLYALRIDDGTVKPGWPVNVGAAIPGFDSACQGDGVSNCTELAEDTGAALLFQGILYVPYAGRGCGPYRGAVVGVEVADPSQVQLWQSGATGGSIDGPPGLSSDGISVFAATGNSPGAAAWSGGDAILRFEPGPVFPNRPVDFWAPMNWSQFDGASWDNGATGVQLFDLPGSNPTQIAAVISSSGFLYGVDRTDLGGLGQPPIVEAVVNTGVAWTDAGTEATPTRRLFSAPAYTSTPQGEELIFGGAGAECPGGWTASNNDLTALQITPGSPPRVSTRWCASQGGQGSPVVSTTDGQSEGLVWGIGAEGDGRLRAFDLATGQVVFAGGGAADVLGEEIAQAQTPIIARGRVYVAGFGQVFAFTAEP